MSIIIRRAMPADAALLVEMIAALAAHHGDHAQVSADYLIEYALLNPREYVFLLAELDGMVAGFADYNIFVNFVDARRTINLDLLYVQKGLRGRGVGKELTRAIMREGLALGCAEFRIGARKDNAATVAIYRGFGFAEEDRGPSLRFIANEALMYQLVG